MKTIINTNVSLPNRSGNTISRNVRIINPRKDNLINLSARLLHKLTGNQGSRNNPGKLKDRVVPILSRVMAMEMAEVTEEEDNFFNNTSIQKTLRGLLLFNNHKFVEDSF